MTSALAPLLVLVLAAQIRPQQSDSPFRFSGGIRQDDSALSAKEKEFLDLHRQLQPPKNELWRTIPWNVSILEAREQSIKEKKPVFVWVASGEPLGCG